MTFLTKKYFTALAFCFCLVPLFSQNYIQLAEDFLYSVKVEDPFQIYIDSLAKADVNKLAANLANENQKKAFWLNIYNAFVQIALSKHPEKYKNRNHFFKDKFIIIAHQKLSLDDVEHGIIRHSKNKYSLGYLPKMFPGKFEKTFRLAKVDKRIHFALNCGAKSCPAVSFYNEIAIDEQLDGAMKGYLKSECLFNKEKNEIQVPILLKWFKADFGGKKEMYKLLIECNLIPSNTKPKLKYSEYNWELELKKYK